MTGLSVFLLFHSLPKMKNPPDSSSNHPNSIPLRTATNKMVIAAGAPTAKKRQRAAANSTTSSSTSRPCPAVIINASNPIPLFNPNPKPTPNLLSFNDRASADVHLRLFTPKEDPDDPVISRDVVLFLHAARLRRCKYFAALLSDRWNHNHHHQSTQNDAVCLNLVVPPSPNAMETRVAVLELLYADDISAAVTTAAEAIEYLPVALELLFEDCVRLCVRFLEAVPWTEEEETRVLSLIPLLSQEESAELMARVSPSEESGEKMLYGLITSVIHNPNMAYVKAFVAKLLREFSSRESAEKVLELAFLTTFKVVKDSMEEYTSPGVRGDNNETEAIQRLNLHTAMTNGRHLLWLVERMIELRVAGPAVREWSEQPAFTADLQRAFRDDAWRNIVPGLPGVLIRCTSKLSNAIASGAILVPAQVRKKLVNDWLPVLIVCKDNTSPLTPNNRPLYQDLEETFLKIISTLPMLDAQELLQQCLCFSTRNFDDCPHLVMAFNTWFRRAARPPQALNP